MCLFSVFMFVSCAFARFRWFWYQFLIEWTYLFSNFSEQSFLQFYRCFSRFKQCEIHTGDWLSCFFFQWALYFISFAWYFRLQTSPVVICQAYGFILTSCSCTCLWLLKTLRYWNWHLWTSFIPCLYSRPFPPFLGILQILNYITHPENTTFPDTVILETKGSLLSKVHH